jgi:hypothetical protein
MVQYRLYKLWISVTYPIQATEFFKMVQYRLQIYVKGFSTGYSFLGNGAMQAKYLSYMVQYRLQISVICPIIQVIDFCT